MEKNTYKKIRETHTNGHAQKIRIFQVLINNMWIWQIGTLVSLFYSFKYLLFYLTFSPLYRPVPAALGSPFLRPKSPS